MDIGGQDFSMNVFSHNVTFSNLLAQPKSFYVQVLHMAMVFWVARQPYLQHVVHE